MAKKVLIILADGFEEIEAIAPIDILRRAGVEVTVAGLSHKPAISARKVAIEVDKALADCGDIFDAVVLPGGGQGAQHLALSVEVSKMVRKMYDNQSLIAAICAAPAVVLAPLGILHNKTATCFPGMQGAFGKTTVYKEEAVVVDGNIITSRGPGTAMEFALALLEKLTDKAAADKVRRALLLR